MTQHESEVPASEGEGLSELGQRVCAASAHALVGLEEEVTACLVAVLCGGHVLIEGPPGVAKTLLARSLARALGGEFGRVQFTPDLMPADVTGTGVFHPREGEFRFRPGPIFANYVLCDEINRAPAKTQAALLEAMQEGSVTVDGERHSLPQPFCVLATRNPLEFEGTYPLPEAQLDRFLLEVRVGYPSQADEERLLREAHPRPLDAEPAALGVERVSSTEELLAARDRARAVEVRADLCSYVVRLLAATRADSSLALGASPRAGVALLAAAKARAALEGRDYLTTDDLKAMAKPVLRHRIGLDPGEELSGADADVVLDEILDSVEVPR